MLMIHTADLHLGASPDSREPWGKNRKQELWDSFERLLEEVREKKADLLLISGDLFHRPPLLRELREVNAQFEALGKTKVVLMAGNHDFIGKDSFYHGFVWADNVFFFENRQISRIRFPDLKVEVYGLSYHEKEIREPLYDEVQPEENGYYHILLAHGGDEKHIPFKREKLARSGFDYIAFGHIHKPGMLIEHQAVMAGSLEPTDHTCEGVHGYVEIEVRNGQNRIRLVPFAKREYRKLSVNMTEEDTMNSLRDGIAEMIRRQGKDHIYEVHLCGKRHASMEIMEEKLKSAGNIRKITDETAPFFDYEKLKMDHKGLILEKYILSMEHCETEVEKKALSLGVSALLEVLER